MTVEAWLLLGILVCLLLNSVGGIRLWLRADRAEQRAQDEVDKCALRIKTIDRAKLLLDTAKVWGGIGDRDAFDRIMAEVDEIQRKLEQGKE